VPKAPLFVRDDKVACGREHTRRGHTKASADPGEGSRTHHKDTRSKPRVEYLPHEGWDVLRSGEEDREGIPQVGAGSDSRSLAGLTEHEDRTQKGY